MKKTPRVVILLYVLLGYVFAQFAWWAYLIYDLNEEIAIANDKLIARGADGIASASSDLTNKLWMILGEGSVFLALLIVGAYFIQKSILREQRLALQERNFILATTHEFNSPIASIKLNLQTLEKREIDVAQRHQMIDGALSSAQRLELLVSNLLLASRLDGGKFEMYQEEIDVKSLIDAVVHRFRSLAEKSGNTLNIDCDAQISIEVDKSALDSIISNLIENALKYAPKTEVQIRVKKENNKVILEVSDEGQGIPKTERDRVLRKFYRMGNEETRSQKGSGLGLYLVQQLVQLHDAQMIIRDNSPKGTVFSIKFNQ